MSSSDTRSSTRGFSRDLVAGLTVALVGTPQCLAYSMMSGMPPAYGLVTAAVPGALAAIAGKSRQVVTGPTNTTGLLVLGAMAPWLGSNGFVSTEHLGMLALLTLMAGTLRLVFALVGGSSVVRFLPESVLVGFTAGAGILIVAMQLDEALGLSPTGASGLVAQLGAVGGALSNVAWPALAVTVITAVVLLLGRRLVPSLPAPLIAVVAITLVTWLLGLDGHSGLPLVRDRAAMPAGWPPMALPSFDLTTMRAFLFPALGITLLGTLELVVSARAGGERPDMRREIFAQGVANCGGALCGAIPASASLTRSMLLRLGQPSSRLAALLAALIAVPLLLVPHAVELIPQAVLAGVLFTTALGMIDVARIKRMWLAARQTRVLLIVTVLSALFLPLEWAIISGTGLALLFHLAEEMSPVVTAEPITGEGELVINVSGNLHFAAVETLEQKFDELVPEQARRVVLDVSHAHQQRIACVETLERLDAKLQLRGQMLRIRGADRNFHALLERTNSKLIEI